MTHPTSPQHSQQSPSAAPSQSIPLQNLARSPGEYDHTQGAPGAAGVGAGAGTRNTQRNTANLPGISTYWEPSQRDTMGSSPTSPIDPAALQYALPPEIHPTEPAMFRHNSASTNPYASPTPYYDELPHHDYFESDSAPLTSSAQPISGASLTTPQVDAISRNSFQTVSDLDNTPSSRPRDTKMLGFDLENGPGSTKHRSYGNSLTPTDHRASRSPGTAFYRAGSIVRAMSQRVVNISGEQEAIEQQQRRARSRSPSADGRRSYDPSHVSMGMDTSYPSQVYPPSPVEKNGSHGFPIPMTEAISLAPSKPMPNPLKGRSLGIFGPENPLRKKLCDVLVNPYMEPVILILIVLQAILLAVEAASNVFEPGNERPPKWAGTSFELAMLVLFTIFTLEIIARVIVSGLFLNATEYSTIDRQRGIRAAVADKYQAVFRPQRQKSVKGPREDDAGTSTFARSFTMMHGQRLPETVEEAQRMQLARRAFLRHGFNRLDFTAVISFWITFLLSLSGLEHELHFYIFRMMSCLRIVRLLALTNGTAIILRSLKKAAPLLLRVSFLILFFWILFAIIGIQSFKSSFSRQCVWLDPLDPTNLKAAFTNEFTFCGGHLDNITKAEMPWVYSPNHGTLDNLRNGSITAKGFLCPQGSYCLQGESPYSNTVNFDNIIHSMELVFVIMSANTWSDLMYYTTNSDYLPAALFFGAGIMIMMLWMTNLLIAVITSSFQVIREESKSSAFTDAQDSTMPVHLDQVALQRTSTLQKIYDKTRLVWVLFITFDLLAQSFRSNTMSAQREHFIGAAEVVVTVILDVEIIIRFAANWRSFHRSYRNLFDLFLAVATTVILLPPIRNSGVTYAWLTLFQILRAYRVVLAIPITRKLILLVLGNATGIANLMLFVFLITFLMAILAVQLFRGEIPMYDDNGDLNQISFYNIYNAFLGMYQILSSENWTSILYDVTKYTTYLKTSWYGAIFLIGWFILAFFILVNMFIAVIQENFDVSEDEKRLEQVKAFLQRKELGNNTSNLALSSIFTFGKKRKKKDPLDYGPATMEMLLKDAVVREFLDDSMDPLQETDTGTESPQQGNVAGDVRPGLLSSAWGKVRSIFTSKEPNPFYSNLRFNGPNDALDPREMARQAVSATSARRKAQREYLARHPTYNNSLYIFTPKNPLRRLCQLIVGPGRGSERFDGVEPNKIAWYSFSAFIYAAIVAMVVLACVTTPLYQKVYFETHDPSFSNWFVWVDMGFAIIFMVEAIIKVIADGLFFTPNAYFRSSWGIIDGVVLITLWINVITLLANDGAVSRAVGAFKALRALRLLNISDSARDTFHSLIIVAGWNILGAAFVSISLLIPFAIYAVNLFNGQLVKCNDGDVFNLTDCFGEYNATPFSGDWPMLAPRVAANPYYSFDDFGSSLFILYQIVSQEGWVGVSFDVQAITGPNTQPREGAAPGNGLFFVVFNLMATVFVLTLFISVFMRNYTEQTGVAFLTAEQRSWLELRKLLRQISPSKSSYDDTEKKWKKWCHKRAIEKRGKWYTAITCVLVCHLILLMLEYYPEPEWWTRTRDVTFLIFTLIYIANIVIRIVGLGWTRFRRSSWDVFSLVAVSGEFGTTVLLLSNTSFETYIQLHKFFLVAIVLLLIPRNDALDQLFKTAAASLTTIVNLLATWLVFFLVFAIAFTQTFSLTRFGQSAEANINFRTVPNALILLFRMSAGEGWNEIMEDYAAIAPPFCVESIDFAMSDCGSNEWARALFIAWNLVSMYIFVNLFISLIYESFSYVYQRSSGLANIDRDEIRRFKEAWRSVDPAGTGFISKEAFPRLLGELSGIFEMRIYDAEDSVRQILEDVRSDMKPQARHSSITSSSVLSSVDVHKLNSRLAQVDVYKVRERRRRFNIFFEEVMVSADPDKGISFTTVLMVLAHYNIISDSKSLRLEEFLRRRARLQRVEEEVRRRVVLGFFDTLYWTRRFKKHIEKKKAARMTAIPQLDVPDIFVDEEAERQKKQRATVAPTSRRTQTSTSDYLSASDAVRPAHTSWASSADISTYDTSYAHPLSMSRGVPPMSGHNSHHSAFSFDLQEPGTSSGQSSRRGSAVRPAQVRELLNDSVWVESIRRTATVRKSVRKSDWNGYR
ncbi:calcium-channel protein cch1 [Pseudomassariella vexata]|uniref:Calcium-channel protein CCH1 n=1 Tax=Pseudomassariella vexata TaxID=1141098 RepID=A0A1Y2DSM7_9PEZI|nr:calcium-channel protein cch1 [Pseudomassariella vexata]ORY62291.1 calcium-channel protein cch1 [Pseudomassariella vexata]